MDLRYGKENISASLHLPFWHTVTSYYLEAAVYVAGEYPLIQQTLLLNEKNGPAEGGMTRSSRPESQQSDNCVNGEQASESVYDLDNQADDCYLQTTDFVVLKGPG